MGKTYTMSNRTNQKFQIGDEPDATIVGGTGANCTIVAGNGDRNVIKMGKGADCMAIVGNGHNDTIYGGSGAKDTLIGGDGNVTFFIGSGADNVVRGGAGNDVFHFGLNIGAGDTIEAGGGSNTIVFDYHDHHNVQRGTDAGYHTVTLTDLGRTVWYKDVLVVKFSDGNTL